MFPIYRINTWSCFCPFNFWSGFLITVLMTVQLVLPSLWIESELAQRCSLWNAVNSLYKGAIQGVEISYTLVMKL